MISPVTPHRILITAGTTLAAAALIAVGCHRKAQTASAGPSVTAPSTLLATRPATTASATASRHFAKFGIQLDTPAGWTAKPDKDLELLLVNPDEPGAVISLDVPDLPRTSRA